MNIVLGVTGGIAAYKAVSLARLLVLAGHDVHIVPTEDALRFVGKPTWEAISRNPVTTSVHDDVPEVRHVKLGQNADLVIVAPATANTLARMTAGIADDLLGTTLLATLAPVLVAPAMHTEMWQHPATQHNIEVLRERGINFIGPEVGQLTGADSGPGRMSEPEAIAAAAEALLAHAPVVSAPSTPGDLANITVLVSAGGTREPIDPVRYIGNRSSGRQGVALAVMAARRGAAVTLVSANIDASVLAEAQHPRIRIVPVGTAAELQTAVESEVATAHLVFMAAAVADYRVANVSDGKLRKEDSPEQPPSIELTENPDILTGLVRNHRRPGLVLVGFAAETVSDEQELVERGKRKRARKGVDLLAANAVGWHMGFEALENSLTIINAADEVTRVVRGSKHEVADELLSEALRLLP